ncbi:hypothetical protein EVJ58_g279 [Rhodofomes roseus]|uniref:C2H2-type domain-containing protein n=1 Tax=Rhodofomes roseus TaxID=34475 RepID=A0A4Y9Z6P1_9APHY|nr:hypothetical protein EVJ58_g279 [Rhodofomes roseus]
MPRARKAAITPSARATTPYTRKLEDKPVDSQKWPCLVCSRELSRCADVPRHVNGHVNSLMYDCPWPECAKLDAQFTNMMTHFDAHAKIKRRSCKECGRYATDPATVSRCSHKGKKRRKARSTPESEPSSTTSVASASSSRADVYDDLHEDPVAGPSNQQPSHGPEPFLHSFDGFEYAFAEEAEPQFFDAGDQNGFWAAPEAPSARHDIPATYAAAPQPAAQPDWVPDVQPHLPLAFPPLEEDFEREDVFVDLNEVHAPAPLPAGPYVQDPLPPFPQFEADVERANAYVDLNEVHVPPPPPAYADVDPALQPPADNMVFFPELHGHLYEPMINNFYDVTRHVAVYMDPREGIPRMEPEFDFYYAYMPNGEGFLLDFVPSTSPNFIHAAEVAQWLDASYA